MAATRLQSGDVITSIGDMETAPLAHAQAMQVIKDCGNSLQLGISRYTNYTLQTTVPLWLSVHDEMN